MQNLTYYILGGVAVVLLIVASTWFFFFRSTATVSTNGTATSGFGSVPNTTNTAPASTDNNGSQTVNTTTGAASQKIFKIIDGPIVGATMMQTLRPTTTIARYIRQDDGHVFDVPLGVAGAVPRVVSNITIPGGQRAIWLEGGNAALMQYVDDANIVKTVYLGFPATTTTRAVLPTRIQFLPDNITDIAASPDGKSVVYLIKTANGSDGYIAQDSGINSRKLFSLPLSQLLISWPSANTMFVQTKSTTGVTGAGFAVDISSGKVTQLVSAAGLTATVDPGFANLLYQTADGNTTQTYLYSVKNASSYASPIAAYPEKCIWSKLVSTEIFCADSAQTLPTNYLDLWHQGAASAEDTISEIKFAAQQGFVVAVPGSKQGGVASDILEMALSPDEHYLSYTTKGDRALWGVLLAQ